MSDKILTLHPEGKTGVNIDRAKYDQVRRAIVGVLEDNGEMTFRDLNTAVAQQLEGKFEGSIGWYYTTVKLDLEARQVIERVPGQKPQHLRLVRA